MATVVIPVRSDADNYSFPVTLAGVEYSIHLAWNSRDARWYIGIRDADGAEIISGCALVVDYPLFMRFPTATLPAGFVQAVDTSGAAREIEAKEDLGDRVKLLFTPVGDLT